MVFHIHQVAQNLLGWHETFHSMYLHKEQGFLPVVCHIRKCYDGKNQSKIFSNSYVQDITNGH